MSLMGKISRREVEKEPIPITHDYFSKRESSLFMDMDKLAQTSLAVHIPEIIERREQEMNECVVRITDHESLDLPDVEIPVLFFIYTEIMANCIWI